MKWIDIKDTPLPDEENEFLVCDDGDDIGLIRRHLISSKRQKPHYTNEYVCQCHEGSRPDEIRYWQYAPDPPNPRKGQ